MYLFEKIKNLTHHHAVDDLHYVVLIGSSMKSGSVSEHLLKKRHICKDVETLDISPEWCPFLCP